MKFSAATILAAAFALASPALAQTANTTEYTTGLIAALNAANLTTLAQVLGGFPDVANTFASGANFTVFAPSNEALAPLLADPAALNLTEVLSTLMYHVAPGTYEASALGVGANHTIIPSALMAPLLGANMTQPLVVSIGMDGNPRVRTATQNASVYDTNTYQNVLVHSIDNVLQAPLNLTATVAAANLTALAGALTMVSAELPNMLSMTPRLTIFAPVDSAFAAIADVIPTLNASAIANVLTNHIINGTVVYSDMVTANTTAVSAAGEMISFVIEGNNTFVVSGNGTARAQLIRTDIPIENGVVHLISSVLANTEADPAAAASAASSYAEAATAAPSATAGVGGAAAAGPTGAASKSAIFGAATVLAGVFGAAFAILA